jgi:charged multivesicular body protein 4A/B
VRILGEEKREKKRKKPPHKMSGWKDWIWGTLPEQQQSHANRKKKQDGDDDDDDNDDDDENKHDSRELARVKITPAKKKPPASEAPSASEALATMRANAELMHKKIEHLERQRDEEKKNAVRYHMEKKRQEAVAAMARMKLYDKKIADFVGQKFNLDENIISLENASIQLATVKSMQTGAQAMRRIQKDLSIDNVLTTVDAIQEQMEEGQKISTELSLPMGIMKDLHEDELLEEIELYAAEDAAATAAAAAAAAATNTVPAMPAAPQTTPARSKVSSKTALEDAELEKLAQSMK